MVLEDLEINKNKIKSKQQKKIEMEIARKMGKETAKAVNDYVNYLIEKENEKKGK